MDKIIRLSVGPSSQVASAWDWYQESGYSDDLTSDDSGGWESRVGYSITTWTRERMMAYIQRHKQIPSKVRAAGLKWADATITPCGYNGGRDSRLGNDGIRLTWTLPE